jgi:hypothetical protein
MDERKMLALYRDKREMELWRQAEAKAREEMGESAREGEVLAKICAEYVDEQPVFPEA